MVIDIDTRRRCANVCCTVIYTPVQEHQKWCSDRCRWLMQKRRRQAQAAGRDIAALTLQWRAPTLSEREALYLHHMFKDPLPDELAEALSAAL